MSQSLLFRSVFPTQVYNKKYSVDILSLNPFYSGLYFQQRIFFIALISPPLPSLNPFYSGLYFQRCTSCDTWHTHITLSLNPFYSGLYFQRRNKMLRINDITLVSIPSIQVCISNKNIFLSIKLPVYVLSQSLLFRSVFPTILKKLKKKLKIHLQSQSLLFRSVFPTKIIMKIIKKYG